MAPRKDSNSLGTKGSTSTNNNEIASQNIDTHGITTVIPGTKNTLTPDNTNKRTQDTAINNGKIYFSYEMKNGLDDNHVEGEEEAGAFNEDYSDVILKTHIFHSKDDWIDHKTKRAKIMARNKKTELNEATANSDEANARLIVDSISTNTSRNVDRIEAFYKTTAHSTKAVLLIRFLNQHNNDMWVWKPTWMLDIISKYANKVKQPEDPVVLEAFSNMTYGKQSDPGSADKEKARSISYKPPNSSQVYEIESHTAYTYITIPHEEFHSIQEETDWIVSKATAFLETLRIIMTTPTFRMSSSMIKEEFSKKIFDNNKRSNLPKFLSSAVIRVTPVNSLTDHLIQGTANEITGRLYNNRLQNRKYTSTTNMATDDTNDNTFN